jgi:adenylate cyclase
MQPRTKRQIRIIAATAVVSAALGAWFARRSAEWTGVTLALGIITGGLCGTVLPLLELVAGRTAVLRRLPLLAELALRTAAYGAVFVAAIHTAAALVGAWGATLPPEASVATQPALLFSTLAALAFNIVFMLRAVLGPGAFVSLLLGRYRRPREERRIVLFLDLRSSTGLAERMGDAAFLGLLNRIAYDIGDPILAAGGEIHRYVGDEVIVTWRESGPESGRAHGGSAAIACVFAIADLLARRRTDYEREFHAAPRLRAALHAGHLVVGEMGDIKREIVLLGDVMNTTARIEEACRTTGEDVIASGAVLDGATLPPGVAARSLGPMALRGKAEPIELFALTRKMS